MLIYAPPPNSASIHRARRTSSQQTQKQAVQQTAAETPIINSFLYYIYT
ncbi:hypothetical protein DOY81_007361 [Sarcophaga bullata]|nr:hypothetical protein DOY81_007361 [Sarcophaga bullata]